jgi:hypothetical protein
MSALALTAAAVMLAGHTHGGTRVQAEAATRAPHGSVVHALSVGVTPTDPLYASASWPYTSAQLPVAWQAGTGKPVVVAVVDSGVNATGDLAGAVLPGYNAIDGSTNTADDFGHGTAVATTIAGRGNNGIGTVGVCWGCEILPVKVLGSDGTGLTSTVATGITWAANNGAQVINLSLGGTGFDQAEADAVAYAESKGVVVVAGAGNDGSSSETFYPAAFPGVISVAGSDPNGVRYAWSNYGSGAQVAAPGCLIAPTPGAATFSTWCGTSLASPFVAGIAGLALSDAPATTAAQFAQALEATATSVPGNYVAHGGVNAAATLQALGVSVAAPTVVVAAAKKHTKTTRKAARK